MQRTSQSSAFLSRFALDSRGGGRRPAKPADGKVSPSPRAVTSFERGCPRRRELLPRSAFALEEGRQ